MDAMEKPPLIKPHVYIKFSVCAVLILVYCLMMFFAFYNAHRYTAAVPLELEAEIVKVEYVSTEDSGSYDAIMQYTHKGVIYEAVYDSFSREKDAQAMIGKKVSAVVDAGQPEDTLKELHGWAIHLLSLAGIPVFILVFAPSVPHRQTYVETYGWCVEAIAKDIPALPRYGMIRMLIWVMGCVVMYLAYPNIFDANGPEYLIMAVFAIAVIMAVVGTVTLVRDYLLVKNGKIELRRDTCHSKFSRSDAEYGEQYYVNLTNGRIIWEKNISKAVYEAVQAGDAVDSAYLGNQKKPILNIYNENVL